jgi:uncharacterized protein
MTTKPATILASEVRMMRSKYTGRKYRISVSLPYAYFKSLVSAWPFDKPLKKWPVIYLIDANYFFGMVTDIVRQMAWCGSTTDAIVVGIGYPEDKDPQEAFRDSIAWRLYDFTPVRDEGNEKETEELVKRPSPSGGADGFLNFIRHELIPVIEKDFTADPKKRILAGHSLGGLFTAYALFEEPSLFDTYIVGSPALAYGDRFTFKQEELFVKRRKKLAAKVHLWTGEHEEASDYTMLSDTIRFGAILESRKYKGLILVKQIFTNQNHCEVVAPGFQMGLKMALKQ